MKSSNISSAMLFSVRHGNISTVANFIDKYGVSSEQWSGGYDLLVEALKYRRSAVAKLLLSRGARVNSESANSSQPSPLHFAVENNDIEMIDLLLEMGADINARAGGKRKGTPLFEAVYHNKREITELLLKNGALVDIPNDEAVTPLRVAVDRGYLELVKILLKNGANANSAGEYSKHSGFTPLHVAAMKGSKGILELLLDNGAQADPQSTDSCTTPLHVAVEGGFKDVAQILLSRNANVNAPTLHSFTPLHIAVEKGSKDIVGILLTAGASVHVKSPKSFTPLHLAVQAGDRDVTEMLSNAGSDINAVAEDSVTPLHIAVKVGCLDMVEFLLEHGAQVNATRTDFRTPLHLAVENHNVDIAELLLRSGANSNAELEDLRTPLHVASRDNSTGVMSANLIQVLLNHGANVNAKTTDSVTPLHIAIRNNRKDVVQIFLERGADVDSEDENACTPLCLAVENGCLDIFDNVLALHPDVNNESNQNALSIAMRREDDKEEMIRRLLEYGFSVKPEDATNRDIISCVIRNGFVKVADEIFQYGTDTLLELNLMPLHLATIFRQKEIAEVLLKYVADVNVKDKVGRSSIYFATANADFAMFELVLAHGSVVKDPCELLHLAVKSGSLQIVETLLDRGCDVDCRDDKGRTALHNTNFSLEPLRTTPFFPRYLKSLRLGAAEVDAHSQIADYLLVNGADVSARDNNGENPLHIAAHEGSDGIVQVLLRHQADVNSFDKYGDTALDRAIRSGRLSLCRILLKAGAEVNFRLRELSGKPAPLHLAVRTGDAELVKWLLDCGANIDAVCKEGAAIHMAIRSRPGEDLNLVKILLEFCSVDAQCGQGTPLHLAARHGLKDVVKLLLEFGADINVTDRNRLTPLECARRESSDGSDRHDNLFGGTIGILIDHLAKMTAAELSVSAQNSRYLKPGSRLECFCQNSNRSLTLAKYSLKCKMEIEIMKNTKIGGSNLSYHDILTRSVQQMVRILGNDSIVQTLSLGTYRDIFPMYSTMISSKLELGRKRKELDEECKRVFFENYVPSLPDICVDRIIDYWTNGDLKMLICVCHPVWSLFQEM